MPTGTIQIAASVGGLSIQTSISRSGSGQIAHEVPLSAAAGGTLKTRIANDEGVLTLSGHSLAVDDVVDIYWEGGVRYGMTVTEVTGDDVTVGGQNTSSSSGTPEPTGGAGDSLPDQYDPLSAAKQVPVDTDFDGDKLEMILLVSPKRSHFDFQDTLGASLEIGELPANEPWQWISGVGVANPLAGSSVDQLRLSNGDSSGQATVKLALIYNSNQ